jgi:chromosome segregation protein
MKFIKVKVTGFKSFADTVEFSIHDGITGVVGPNGCGKSNTIEAIRWVMGETSAKRMRGDGMDSVIFNGTDIRPPRSFCEVTIWLENPDGLGPPELKDLALLEITRRIDRGEGSTYRVNGKPVRAKDIQLLFKDAGMGAGSSALVSQGHVGAIINAKPEARRNILEEAAGVAGLSSRRHDAEIRLRATEENLEKAELVEKGLNDQIASLGSQARKAKRRNEIDQLIRAAEATTFLVRRIAAASALGTSEADHAANEETVKTAMVELSALMSGQSSTEAEAKPLLDTKIQAETDFALAKAKVETIRKEIASVRNALANARKNILRADTDIERETAEFDAIKEERALLDDEISLVVDDAEHDQMAIEEATIVQEEARDAMDIRSSAAEGVSSSHALLVAGRDAAARRESDLLARVKALDARVSQMQARIAEGEAELVALPDDTSPLELLQAELEEIETCLVAASDARAAADIANRELALASGQLHSTRKALVNERSSLERAFAGDVSVASMSMADHGYDEALAAALGDAFQAPLLTGEIHWWTSAEPRSLAAPAGTQALSGKVRVPPELAAALAGVGLAADDTQAEAIAPGLLPGQSVVTAAGRLWRWDGYRAIGGAGAAQVIKRKRRLEEIDIETAAVDAELAGVDIAAAAAALSASAASENRLKSDLANARKRLDEERKASERSGQQRVALVARIASSKETLADARSQHAAETAALHAGSSELAAYPSLTASEAALDAARSAQTAAAKAYEAARNALDKVRREAEGRALRVATIRRQIADFEKRQQSIRGNLAELANRRAESVTEAENLAESELMHPDAEANAVVEVEERLVVLLEAQERSKSHEEALASARQLVRDREASLAAMRENRARILAEIKAGQNTMADLKREVEERIRCATDELEKVAGIEDTSDLPDLSACEGRVQRLLRERETLGTVNLLAEQQLGEAKGKAEQERKVREELRDAVRALRDNIGKLNAECRERLLEAFAKIDLHFRDLFKRVFGGGEAYLKLSGSSDPLEAGLEIFASPPGKKLQTMSLLSGGEQALTALALIFAAFLIRPAPICVLDEVDAPLDDANVDKMCRLVNDLASEGTRFLVITHHALTMARCDRLYGVTMAERGVSRVTSLDMDQAISFVERNAIKD